MTYQEIEDVRNKYGFSVAGFYRLLDIKPSTYYSWKKSKKHGRGYPKLIMISNDNLECFLKQHSNKWYMNKL